jgi:hypothetical protein
MSDTPKGSGAGRRITQIQKGLACFWSVYAMAITVVEFWNGVNWNASSLTLGNCFGHLMLVCLFGSGIMLMRDRQWAKWIQIPLILWVFCMTFTLTLFYLWRHNYGNWFWFFPITAGFAFITLAVHFIAYLDSRRIILYAAVDM